jgi:iron complex outermembrane receptor protein
MSSPFPARRLLWALAQANMLSATLIVSICAAFFPARAHAADTPPAGAAPSANEDGKPVVKLGTVTVNGGRPSALPSYIPTVIEGITGAEIENKINATDAEDALKYFPSLLVRKRNIGDYDHAVLSSRASGTGNSARSLMYADGILLSNLLGNGASFTPRWGLVTPEEIERLDVLYGPFSAAFPGNSVGAVVDYITRMPERFEAHAKAGAFTQHYHLYRTDARYSGNEWSASIGSREGAFAWWLAYNRLDNDGQPLTFATKLLSTGTVGNGGTAVTGAVLGQSVKSLDQWIIGAGTQTNLTQDHAKLKLAYDFAPSVRLSYTFGLWKNEAFRNAESFLRDANGNPVYSGNINIAGRQFTVAATELSQNRADLEHYIHGLSLKSNTKGAWDWEVAASEYDYHRDLVRTPTGALPAANAGGAGRITDQTGTGWTTFAAKGIWRPADDLGKHQVDIGVQQDHYKLRNKVSNTSQWITGSAESRFSAFNGDTELTSVYAQDTWSFRPDWRATLGARAERWEARDGSVSDTASTLAFAPRREKSVSPKGAIAWQAAPEWVLRASLGRAIRYPTVSELYQGSISANVIVNNDPNLKPEKSWTSELTAERDLGNGVGRATLFYENTRDALYSQTNVTVFPNVTNIQNVDQIRTKGLELAWNAVDLWIRGLDVNASYTFASSIIEKNDKFPASVGKWQPRVPRHRATLLLSYRPSEPWTLTAGVRYSGRQYSALDNSDTNGYAYTGVTRFLVGDLRARYRFDKRWSAALGVDNVNDAEYWNFHPYPRRTWVGEVRFDY